MSTQEPAGKATEQGLPNSTSSRWWLVVSALLGGILLALAVVYHRQTQRYARYAALVRVAQPAPESNTPRHGAETPIVHTIDELYEAYSGNQVAADKRFKGKTITIEGVVSEVGNNNDNPTERTAFRVILMNPKEQGIVVLYPRARENEVAKLRKGDRTTITGACVGARQNMWLLAPTIHVP